MGHYEDQRTNGMYEHNLFQRFPYDGRGPAVEKRKYFFGLSTYNVYTYEYGFTQIGDYHTENEWKIYFKAWVEAYLNREQNLLHL